MAVAVVLTFGCAAPRPVASPTGPQTALPPPETPAIERPAGPGSVDEPLKVGGDVKAPILIQKVEPIYPLEARKSKIQGVVVIEAVITDRGEVIRTRVLRSDNPLLERPALDAVQQWRFQPATRNGKPVSVLVVLTSTFNLPGFSSARRRRDAHTS